MYLGIKQMKMIMESFFKHSYKGKMVSKYIAKMIHSGVLTSPPAENVACPQATPSLSQSLSTETVHANYSSSSWRRWHLQELVILYCSAIAAILKLHLFHPIGSDTDISLKAAIKLENENDTRSSLLHNVECIQCNQEPLKVQLEDCQG